AGTEFVDAAPELRRPHGERRLRGVVLMDSTIRSNDTIEVTGGSLVVLSPDTGAPVGAPLTVGVEPCTIGRGVHCQLVVSDPEVSDSHCSLMATAKGVRLTDLGAKNGTYLHPALIADSGFVFVTMDARFRCGQSWLELRVAREQVPISSSGSFGGLVGRSEVMRAIYRQLERVAPTNLNVLITGETGTGKEVAARAIHTASAHASGPFVAINCSSIPASLAESTLFGHEKGAFTGADRRAPGQFEAAHGGTLFLDELGELPSDIQPKFLRALQTKEILAVGAKQPRTVDVRLVAATNRDLHKDVNEGRFRADLFHRLNQVEIWMPPLRERMEDIPALVASFFAEFGDADAVTRLDALSRERLQRYDWPGNVRELRSKIEVAYAFSQGGLIEIGELGHGRTAAEAARAPQASLDRPYDEQKREHADAFDRAYFTQLLSKTKANVSEMARVAGTERSTVRDALKRLGLRKDE
ncbi:MAG: sigma 54-interacting transcriptional regulator, partial [Polyangiaceae bacterium]